MVDIFGNLIVFKEGLIGVFSDDVLVMLVIDVIVWVWV